MAPTTMKCRLPNVHELFVCVDFAFSGCYSSKQLSQNNILLTTIKFKTFQDYFVKFKDFKALNLVQSNSMLFKTFKALYGLEKSVLNTNYFINLNLSYIKTMVSHTN